MSRFPVTLEAPRHWFRLPGRPTLEPVEVGGWDGQPPQQVGWWIAASGVPERFDLPEHVLPFVLQLDPEDTDAVLAFVERFGFIGVTQTDIWQGRYEGVQRELASFDGTSTRFNLDPTAEMGAIERLDDFVLGIHALQRAALIASELSQPDGFNIRALSGVPMVGDMLTRSPENQAAARHQFKWIVNTGLSAFELQMSDPQEGHEVMVANPPHCLFAVVCLEIAASAEQGLPWRRCRREGCEAEMFQPTRPSQIYHSRACASAVASKASRDRKRLAAMKES